MKRKIYISIPTAFIISFFLFLSCEKNGGGLALLSVEQELELGRQTDSTIMANPGEYPILDREAYPEAYEYMEDMMNEIMQTDEMNRKSDYVWKLTIIDKEILNAFAVPGGYIYFYTGLMRYLENSAQIAGVLAHEMAHVDRRHSNRQITKAYGLDVILGLIFGDNSGLGQIAEDLAKGLSTLHFSRDMEYEADEYSVKYLNDTKYHPIGIEGFFVKMLMNNETGETLEFLSTHPSDQKRIDHLEEVCKATSCMPGEIGEDEYNALIESLP
ncbi:MAG: M48 family metalloprotease [Bacteroidetes bacterium]|jgi:predicted Zn-dependent protease|nr:M48 family metalloprotease [Bacteroidota bacterium]